MRPAAVAGAFYPADPRALRDLVAACYAHRLGPGDPPEPAPARRGRLKALVVPHAGLAYSGPVAAHAYAALASDGLPAVVLVVGPSHDGLGGLAATSGEDWATPLGTMRQHDALRTALEAGLVLRDDAAHAGEHSVEVQLPFLQDLAARAGRDLAFAPLVMGLQDETTAQEVGQAIAGAVRRTGVDAVLVASSDLMHAGPAYGLRPPPGLGVDAWAKQQDALALEAVEALDPDALLDVVRARDISMCGAGPVAAVLHAAKALGATRAEVLAHATSHDVQPHHSCVGYAAVALR